MSPGYCSGATKGICATLSICHTYGMRMRTRTQQKLAILVLSFSRYGGQLGTKDKNECRIAWRDTMHVLVFSGDTE